MQKSQMRSRPAALVTRNLWMALLVNDPIERRYIGSVLRVVLGMIWLYDRRKEGRLKRYVPSAVLEPAGRNTAKVISPIHYATCLTTVGCRGIGFPINERTAEQLDTPRFKMLAERGR